MSEEKSIGRKCSVCGQLPAVDSRGVCSEHIEFYMGILPKKGDTITVEWGRYLNQQCAVYKVTKNHVVHAQRWVVSKQYWTIPRRVYRRKYDWVLARY